MSDELAQREMTLAEWVGRLGEQYTASREYAALVDRCEQAEADLAAERIENAHLREAFVTMERAYNANESDLAALRQRHAEAVEAAFTEAYQLGSDDNDAGAYLRVERWLASEAKARLT